MMIVFVFVVHYNKLLYALLSKAKLKAATHQSISCRPTQKSLLVGFCTTNCPDAPHTSRQAEI